MRRSTVSSEFPSGIDRIVGTSRTYRQRQSSSTPTPPPKQSDQDAPSVAKLQAVNRQMGEMMAKCIDQLESEIFPTIQPNVKDKQEEDAALPIESTTADVDVDDQVVDYDSDGSNDDDNKKLAQPTEAPSIDVSVQNEATIVMALAGLKHIRDVLLDKQAHFDASIFDDNKDQQAKTLDTNDDWKWDLVDHKEVADSSSPPPSAARQKQAAIFVPPQTSSSFISADDTTPITTTTISYEKDKPLPPIATTAIYPELPQVAVPYIPAHPAPPKQQIKYRIEDLLSDPDLQLLSPKASNNSKFKWMVDTDNSKPEITATSPSTYLFKADQVPPHSPRKRTSFIINKRPSSIGSITSAATIDPLDVKNIENRKVYEYDMLQQPF